jgi:hypothetical protein
MQFDQPVSPVQPVVGDHRAWPTGRQSFSPYGVSLQAGDLLQQTLQMWRDDALRLLGITALPYGFMLLAMIGLVAAGFAIGFDPDHLEDSGPFMGLVIGGGGGLLISAALLLVAAAAGTFQAVEERLRGEHRADGVVGMLLLGIGSLGRLMWAYVAVGLAMSCIAMPALALSFGAFATESVGLGVVAFLTWMPTVIACIYASLRLIAVGPAIVAEDLGVMAGIRRSLELTSGNVGDVFVASLAFGAVLLGVNMAMTVLGLIPLFGLFVQFGSGIVLGSAQSVFMFLVYAALRDRTT